MGTSHMFSIKQSGSRRKAVQRSSFKCLPCYVSAGILVLLIGWISFCSLIKKDPYLLSAIARDQGCPSYGCLRITRPLDFAKVHESKEEEKTYDSALVTRQSNQHSFNQDRAIFIPSFHTTQQNRHAADDDSSFLIGIFDGHLHDGHVVAEHVAVHLPRILAERLNARPCCQPDAWIAQQLNETFVQVNEELPPFAAMRGGCTSSVSLRLGNKLFVANAGDSRTIVVQQQQQQGAAAYKILYSSRQDKAHMPDERARIMALGGNIHVPPDRPNGSRVVVYSAAAKPPDAIGLAMSRSLGDWEWKEVGVTAEPIVDVVDLLPGCFLLAASDGVWDMRQPDFVAKRFIDRVAKDGPLRTIATVIGDASPKNAQLYRDDITLGYVNLPYDIPLAPHTLVRKAMRL